MKKTVLFAVLLVALMWVPANSAFACPPHGGPCYQDPGDPGGGGGGGPWCANPTCWGCGYANEEGWAPCEPYAGQACNCNYLAGTCSPYGDCTYTGP